MVDELLRPGEGQRLAGRLDMLGPRLQCAQAAKLLGDALERRGEDLFAPPRLLAIAREARAAPSS